MGADRAVDRADHAGSDLAGSDLAGSDHAGSDHAASDHNRADRFRPFPLTDQQQAYLAGRSGAFDLGNVSTHAYYEYEGELDLDRFIRAWQRVIDRHDMLRAVIEPSGESQRVLPPAAVPLFQPGVLDLRDRTNAEQEVALAGVRERLSHEVRPPDVWPLFTVVVTLLAADRSRVQVSFDGLTLDYLSWQLLVEDLTRYYDDPELQLPELGTTFREYVLAEQAGQDSAEYRKAAAYWKSRAESLPPAPKLPARRAGRPEQTGHNRVAAAGQSPSEAEDGRRGPRWTSRAGRLEAPAWQAATAYARKLGLTPTALCLAVYAEVLAAWADEPRFTLNVPRMNRVPRHPDVDRVLGEFASFSLLAVDQTAGRTFAERAKALQRQLWRDLGHSQVTGVQVLRELIRGAGGFSGALMPVVLTSTLAFDAGPRPLLGARLRRVFAVSQTPQVHLDVQIEEVDGSLVYNVDSVDDAFPPGLAGDLHRAFDAMLHRLATDREAWDDPDLIVAPIPAGAGPDAPIPDELVQDGFLRWAAAEPDRVAVITPTMTLSYGQLRSAAARLADRLLALSPPGDELLPADESRPAAEIDSDAGIADPARRAKSDPRPVAIVMEKGAEQVVAAYAVLFAGAPYVPIDGTQPTARIERLLATSGARTVLTQPWLRHELLDYTVLEVDLPAAESASVAEAVAAEAQVTGAEEAQVTGAGEASRIGRPGGHPAGNTGSARRVRPDDLAYLLFTSGSTGEPKGVMIEHRGMVNCLSATAAEFGIGPDDRVLGVTALHHDMSTFDLFGILGAGGAIVLPERGLAREAAAWAELIRAHRVTVWNSVPTMLEMLLTAAPDAVAGLRLAFLGGDWINLRLPGELARQAPQAELVSVGGPTETTLWNIWHRVGDLDPDAASIPYGRPIANTTYRVLDAQLRDRPVWAAGELCASGPGVARGYWRQPDLTAERFVRCPRTGDRLCRTGDLGRRLPDGTLEILGRIDGQVKIGGMRIEPGEIEAALVRLPGVSAAAVVAVPEPGRRRGVRLAAYVVGSIAPAEIRADLTRLLPSHLVPVTIEVLAALPLTRNDKVDRSALIELAARSATVAGTVLAGTALAGTALEVGRPDESPILATGASDVNARAGQSAVEQVVALTWAELLGLGSIPADADFFALGGDSLRATAIVARLRSDLDLDRLTMAAVFATPTVAGLAAAILADAGGPSERQQLQQVAEIQLEIAALSDDDVAAELALMDGVFE